MESRTNRTAPTVVKASRRRSIRHLLANPQSTTDELRCALADTYVALQDASAHLYDLLVPSEPVPLSTAESVAVIALLKHVGCSRATVVAGQIADKQGVSRTALCTGLRKLQAAGILRAKSLGRCGTRIDWVDRDRAQRLVSAGA